jgi:hypothetical protein
MEQPAGNASSSDAGWLPPGDTIAVWALAEALGVHRTHITNLLDQGEIKCAIDLRGKGSSRSTIRIPRSAILEFIEKRQVAIATITDKRATVRIRCGKRARKH